MKYKLLGVQWYPFINKALLTIVNSNKERIYEVIDRPKFDFYIAKGDVPPNTFYLPKEDLVKHTCEYNYRFNEIAKLVNFPLEALKGESKQAGRAALMYDPRLFHADNQIEYDIMQKWIARHEAAGTYDPMLEGKRVYFDIETHAAANMELYERMVEFTKKPREEFIANDIEVTKADWVLIKFGITDMIRSQLLDPNVPMNELMIKSVFLLAKNSSDIEYKYMQDRIKNIMWDYRSKIGVVDENIADDRVDTITTYDSQTKTFYIDFLNIFEDMLPEYFDRLENPEYIDRYRRFLNYYDIKIQINNTKKIRKRQEETGDNKLQEFLDIFDIYSRKEQDAFAEEITLDEYIEEFSEFAGLSFDKNEIKLEFNRYNTEQDLLIAYLTRLKTVIQPVYLLAHNSKYDILTITNRLHKLGIPPIQLLNQTNIDFTKYENGIESFYRVDTDADRPKKDSTFFDIPGMIPLDTLLMVAKSSQREKDLGLNALVRDELNDSKFEYGAKGVQFLYEHSIDEFIKYAAIDTLLLKHLDDALGLVSRYQTVIDNSFVPWSKYATPSVISYNNMKAILFEEFNLVMATNKRNHLNNIKTEPNEKLTGAYVTDVADVGTSGVHSYAMDSDASAYYPSTMISLSTWPEKLLIRFMDLKKFTLLVDDKLEFARKHLSMPTKEEIYRNI